jgi:hypothetical protein
MEKDGCCCQTPLWLKQWEICYSYKNENKIEGVFKLGSNERENSLCKIRQAPPPPPSKIWKKPCGCVAERGDTNSSHSSLLL